MSDFKVETKCLHSGYTPSKGEPCALPICQSTTYNYDTTDEMGQLFDLKAEPVALSPLNWQVGEKLQSALWTA